MRTNLIMHFHCSECGHQLNISYPNDAKSEAKEEPYGFTQKPEEPSGAYAFNTPKISIDPCRSCIEKYTVPAKKLTDAIKTLTKI